MDYVGKNAVVTGAASGIGRALAAELASRGATVAASDKDKSGLDSLVESAKRLRGRILPYEVDVSDRHALLSHAGAVRADVGEVNIVVNNAGVSLVATVEEMTLEDFDWLLSINLLGVINGSKAFLPSLIASGDGHLVNMSSVFGLIAPASQSAYATAKFGVRGFTEALRQEMIMSGHRVTVHCVHPGGVRTNVVRNSRRAPSLAQPREQAARDFERIACTRPEKAALTILRGVEKDRARILIGPDARLVSAVSRLIGAHYEGLLARAGRRSWRRRLADHELR